MKKPKDKSNSNLIFLFMLVIVCSLWLVNMYLFVIEKKAIEPFDKGTFGDMFGAVNALFSGLAFAGLIYTAMMQREELELQRQELGLTREEFKRMVATQELSEQALKKQAQAYIYSAILNGRNSFVTQLNKEIDELKKNSIPGLNLHDDKIWDKENQLRGELKLIQETLNKLSELEKSDVL